MKYALVNNNTVEHMIQCETEQDFQLLMESMPSGVLVGEWIHITTETNTNGSEPGLGWKFDSENRKFYPPQPFPSWILDENYVWRCPVERPEDTEKGIWDETTQEWIDCVNCYSQE